MNKTTRYQLNQWDKSDRIQMEDFNADNEKLEQALSGQAEALTAVSAAVAKCGNCKIVYGSYTGNGKYGEENPTILTFNGMPVFVLVIPVGESSPNDIKLSLLRGVPYAMGQEANSDYYNMVTWTENGVQWYTRSNNNFSSEHQFNKANSSYGYLALLAMA